MSDKDDLFEAAAKVMKRHGIAMTQQTKRELEELGIPVFPGVEVLDADTVVENAVMIGGLWHPLGPLSLPDNKVTFCAFHCGRLIQYRPHLDYIKTKICMFCAADVPEKAQ
jgi:hypothetical protein